MHILHTICDNLQVSSIKYESCSYCTIRGYHSLHATEYNVVERNTFKGTAHV